MKDTIEELDLLDVALRDVASLIEKETYFPSKDPREHSLKLRKYNVCMDALTSHRSFLQCIVNCEKRGEE